jgi:hypothetical protein
MHNLCRQYTKLGRAMSLRERFPEVKMAAVPSVTVSFSPESQDITMT